MTDRAIVPRTPDPHVAVDLPGILLFFEIEMSVAAFRSALDELLERMSDRKVSIVITSLDPPDVSDWIVSA